MALTMLTAALDTSTSTFPKTPDRRLREVDGGLLVRNVTLNDLQLVTESRFTLGQLGRNIGSAKDGNYALRSALEKPAGYS